MLGSLRASRCVISPFGGQRAALLPGAQQLRLASRLNLNRHPPNLKLTTDASPSIRYNLIRDETLNRLQIFVSLQGGSLAADSLQAFGLLEVYHNDLRDLSHQFQSELTRYMNSRASRLGADHTSAASLGQLTLPPSNEPQVVDRWILGRFIAWAASSMGQVSGLHLSPSKIALHAHLKRIASLVDLRQPQDLYPRARRRRRRIHLHVGPTNSGKTHTALRDLHAAHNGVYAGPLRLLAHEVFRRMNEGLVAPDLRPRPCNLLTGEEQHVVDLEAPLVSCTVEMLSLDMVYDVCVIDEIQMMASDSARGNAWTEALLGVQALTIHVCGEEGVVDLVTRIARACGDEVIVNRYQRLTPLAIAKSSLHGQLKNIKAGDCIVAFTRSNIHTLKQDIESSTGLRVGLAYGGLPPAVRAREARLFNEGSTGYIQKERAGPSTSEKGEINPPAIAQATGSATSAPEKGYDVLVGSDALGMGLNLKIRRIIFESLSKFNGKEDVPLTTSQIKQIGGRAGRFTLSSPKQSTQQPGEEPHALSNTPLVPGEVLTLRSQDMPFLAGAMASAVVPLHAAYVKAPSGVLASLAQLLPPTIRFSTLLGLRAALTVVNGDYQHADESATIRLAEALEGIDPLSLHDREVFCTAPASGRDPIAVSALQTWALAHARRREALLEPWVQQQGFEAATFKLEKAPASSTNNTGLIEGRAFQHLESMHRSLVVYLWLACRFSLTFTQAELARRWKTRIEGVMGSTLSQSSGKLTL